MKRTAPKSIIVLLLAWTFFTTAESSLVWAGDWMTWRSTYTHDPMTGHRVDQYAQPVAPFAPDQGNLVKSGYRQYRSTLQAGESADNMHIVHEWGRPVMPYEHWRFPYRPYGVPYQAWGPPTPSVLGNFGFGGGGPAFPYPNGNGGQSWNAQPSTPNAPYTPPAYAPPAYGYPNTNQGAYPLVPPFQPAPYYDGLYPSAPPLNPQSDPSFFYRPQ